MSKCPVTDSDPVIITNTRTGERRESTVAEYAREAGLTEGWKALRYIGILNTPGGVWTHKGETVTAWPPVD